MRGNLITGNQGIGNAGDGLHLSDLSCYSGPGTVPTAMTLNLALHNTLFGTTDSVGPGK